MNNANIFYITFIVFFLFVSCKNSTIKNRTNRELPMVELKIINDTILGSGLNYLDSGKHTQQEVRDSNKLNIITYQILNKTNQNLLFVIDEDDLVYDQFAIKSLFNKGTDSDNALYRGGIFFDIRDNQNNQTKYYSFLGSDAKLNYNKFINEEAKLRLKKLNYPRIDKAEYSELIRKNSFVLHPQEYKIFQSILSLPLEKESNKYNSVVSEFDLDESLKYNFSLFYFCDAKLLKQMLPNIKIKELEDNNIVIYDGILRSDDIPIKIEE